MMQVRDAAMNARLDAAGQAFRTGAWQTAVDHCEALRSAHPRNAVLPHLHGAITHKAPADTSYELALSSLQGPRIRQAQGLDGVFIAARREWIDGVGFDTARIPGFHFYDLDFSYRASLAGARLTIACDLALIHQSRGNVDAGWNAAQAAFAAKFPTLNSDAGKHRHWYHVSLPDEDAVALHYAKLFTAWKLRLE